MGTINQLAKIKNIILNNYLVQSEQDSEQDNEQDIEQDIMLFKRFYKKYVHPY